MVVACFESKDSRQNLDIGLAKIEESIQKLNDSMWRDKKIVLTLFGDYQFLCNVYGISGPCGKYPCLWCHIEKNDIQNEVDSKSAEERNLKTMQRNLDDFNESGKDIKNAKEYFNVINHPLLNIDLDMVCPPYLHILLGVVKRHHDLLLKDMTSLDEDIGKYLAKSGMEYGQNKYFLEFIANHSKYLKLVSEQKKVAVELEQAIVKKK